MEILLYDGQFDGFLSAIFYAYEYGYTMVDIQTAIKLQPGLYGTVHHIATDDKKAARVLSGLEKRISITAMKQFYMAFLSGLPGLENILFDYCRMIFLGKHGIYQNLSDPAIIKIKDVARKVYREKHRMEAFIRFQLTGDGIYYALCEPDYDVLPLINDHFRKRYADQRWLIYDAKRKYGLYYDLEKVETITVCFEEHTSNGTYIATIYDEKEMLYQDLWRQYFRHTNIDARKNTKLHIQHMPRRYWRWLTEKQAPGT